MLRYLNAGQRRYGTQPVFIYKRGVTEFQAVLTGTARPTPSNVFETSQLSPRLSPRLSPSLSPRLWVFGPDTPHGWTDAPHCISQVLVFQFSEVNPMLHRAMGEDGYLTKTIDADEISLLHRLHADILPHAQSVNGPATVWMDKVKAELTLLALRGVPVERMRAPEHTATLKVSQALAWYRERMAEAPDVHAVARAVHVSPPHLRRLFHQVANRSPHACFHELRMSEALRLLRGGNLRVHEISDQLGFSEPAAFTRAFRNFYHIPPSRHHRILPHGPTSPQR